MAIVCSSCKREVVNLRGTTTFSCPGCGNVEFTRCPNCRSNAVRYTCQECGFSGPN